MSAEAGVRALDPPPWTARLRESWPMEAPRLRRRLARIAGEGEADDLLQDVFERALRARPEDLSAPAVSAWLLRIARHAAIDRLRARAIRERPPADVVAEGAGGDGGQPSTPEVALQRSQMCACITGLVQRLPPGQRDVLELAELHGLSDGETAARLKLSLGAAKIRLHRARRSLGALMRGECLTFRDERNELACEPVLPVARAGGR